MDIPNHFSHLTKHEKKLKLRPFEQYYFSNQGNGFKFLRMPYWINTYGYWMQQEVKRELPRYYRIFKRGTVVMVDFGVQIASEFSGPHFAVVLNRNDNKYNPVITVIPLSSKEKRWYANLGDELMQRISDRFNTLKNSADQLTDQVKHDLENFKKDLGKTRVHNFSKKDSNILIDAGVAQANDKLSFTLTVGGKNTEIRNYFQAIKNAPGYEHSESLQKYVALIERYLALSDSLQKQLDVIQALLPALTSLTSKYKQYNKPTFANTRNLTTVSKLRVVKFSSDKVSENIQISEKSMNEIERKINLYI